jgi:mannose-6-phosphate isomerase-like protein (cupin superfamily)
LRIRIGIRSGFCEGMEFIAWLAQKLSLFSDHWNPRIVVELNGQLEKLVKFKGPFDFYFQEQEDELFYMAKGSFDMEFRYCTIPIQEGEFLIVPCGVEHRSYAKEEVKIMLFEPANPEHRKYIKTKFRKER